MGRSLTVPMETIISLRKMSDESGNENLILIKYDSKNTGEILLKIIKDFNQFYDFIYECIKNKKDMTKKLQNRGVTVVDFSSIKEYLRNGGVVMQTFKCPECGASLDFPDKVDTTTCQFCGNKIKAVDLFERIKSII